MSASKTVATILALSGDQMLTSMGARPLHCNSSGATEVLVTSSKQNCLMRLNRNGLSAFAGNCSSQGSYADGNLSAARFSRPQDLVVDCAGTVYVSDPGNEVIRRVNQGEVTTIAGTPQVQGYVDGPANKAKFNMPWTLQLNDTECPERLSLLIYDKSNRVLRTMDVDREGCPTACAAAQGGIYLSKRQLAITGSALVGALLLLILCVYKLPQHYRILEAFKRQLVDPLIPSDDRIGRERTNSDPFASLPTSSLPRSTVPGVKAEQASKLRPSSDDMGKYQEAFADVSRAILDKSMHPSCCQMIYGWLFCKPVIKAVEVRLAGSMAKGTAIREKSDIDMIVTFEHFKVGWYDDYIKQIKWSVKKGLEVNEAKSKANHHEFTFRGIHFDVLVASVQLPSKHPQCFSLDVGPIERYRLRASCSKLAVEYVRSLNVRHASFADTVRVAKSWRPVNLPHNAKLPCAALIELIVGDALDSINPQGTDLGVDESFDAFLQAIERFEDLKVIPGTYNSCNIPVEIHTTRPIVMDPADPTNNLAGDLDKHSRLALARCTAAERTAPVARTPSNEEPPMQNEREMD